MSTEYQEKKLSNTITTITDPDGEVLDISDMKMVGFEVVPELPELTHKNMTTIATGLAQAMTFEKRTMPLYKKISVLWTIFLHLFFDVTPPGENQNFMAALEKVYRYKEPKLTKKQRWEIFKRQLRDYFIRPKKATITAPFFGLR